MRIAVFSDNFYPELSGISDSIITTAKELARRGHLIHFYAPRYGKRDYAVTRLPHNEPQEKQNIEVSRFASLPYPTGTMQSRAVLPTALRWLIVRKFKPDIAHIHLPFGTGIEGMLSAKILRIPLVGTNHTPISEFIRYSPIRTKWFEKFVVRFNACFYNQCNFVSSPSNAILNEMRAYGFKRPSYAVPNPVDTSAFKPLGRKKILKKKFGFSSFTVLYAGRLAEEKNIELILHAAQALKEKIPVMDIAIVGRGSYERKLRLLASSLNIAERVHFTGFVDLHTLPLIYNASDVFVMPSTAETQSIAMMNAMACGLPVIALKAWGLKEYVPPETGTLIEPGDVYALPRELERLYANPRRRTEFGRKGRAFVENFSPPKIASQWENIYYEEIAKYNARKHRGLLRIV